MRRNHDVTVAGHPNGNRKFKVTIKGKPEVYRDCVGLDNRLTKASNLEKKTAQFINQRSPYGGGRLKTSFSAKKDKKEDTLVNSVSA